MSKYIGTPVVSLVTDTVDVTGDITTTDATPEVIIVNDTHEDTDGGREGKVTFKGQQSGGEETTLAQIQASHDGTSDDQKGDLIFKTNDGADGSSPTEAMRIDSEQNLGLGTNAPAHRLDIVESANAFGARITNNSDSSQGLQVRTSDNDTGQYILDLQSRSSATGTDYASKMGVEKGGNVGIGTTAPSRKFHLHEAASSQPVVFAMSTAGTGATTSAGFNISIDGSSGAVNLIQRENAAMQFYTNGGSNERMRIADDGNVAIGHTSPTAPLDVRTSGASGRAAEFHNTSGYGVDIGSESNAVAYSASGFT